MATCPSTRRLRQPDQEFKSRVGYIITPSSINKSITNKKGEKVVRKRGRRGRQRPPSPLGRDHS